ASLKKMDLANGPPHCHRVTVCVDISAVFRCCYDQPAHLFEWSAVLQPLNDTSVMSSASS
ncbi:16582_t:CDS:2, partial [Dentiscutata erythropus]